MHASTLTVKRRGVEATQGRPPALTDPASYFAGTGGESEFQLSRMMTHFPSFLRWGGTKCRNLCQTPLSQRLADG